MNIRFLRVIRALFVIVTATIGAEFDLDLYASRFDSIPIAVLTFTPSAGEKLREDRPWRVIADDLEFTGRFQVLRTSEADSAIFAENNIGIYIGGEYRAGGSEVEMECFLHDASTNELIVGKKYKGSKGFLRTMAHRYANEIVEMIVGDRGMFETKIVFVREGGTRKNLWLMDYDGHNLRRITNMNVVNIFPCFADSNTVVWTSYMRGKPDLYRGSISTGRSGIFIYSRFVETSPAASSIENKLAYASSREGNLDIYTCNLDKSETRRLTHHRGIDTSPAWSPNGYHIAFTSDRAGGPQIYVMDKDGANTKRVTFEGRYQDSPSWSPRGDRIAYASLQNGKFDVWTVKPSGQEAAKVTSGPGHNDYPCWSPDASHIAFVNTRGGKSDICMIRPDGSDFKRVTSLGNAKMPDWMQLQ